MTSESAHNTYRKLVTIALSLLLTCGLVPLGARGSLGPTTALAETTPIDEITDQGGQGPLSSLSPNVSEPEDVLPSSEPDEFSEETISPEDEAAIEAEESSEISVRSGISLRSSQMILDYYSQYSDAPFLKPSTTYNHTLAQMSIHMAICSNRPIPYSSNLVLDPDKYLLQYLTDCGFTSLRADDYDKTPSLYTVATAMGSKRLIGTDGKPFTLIAVGVCGGNYKKEWLSNMTIGSGLRHQGFDSAARMVTDRIYGYIGSNHITGRVKVWITGFSRAGAITNLTAANLDDAGTIAKKDIFAYTFATPRTTLEPTSEGYENIYNIVGPMDMVPQMAPAEWGFGRYGTDLILPGAETDTDFGRKYELVKDGFVNVYDSSTNYNAKLNLALRLAMGLFLEIVDSPEEYEKVPEAAILSLLEDRSPQNVLRSLRSITVTMKDDDPDKRELENQLIDFIGRLATGFVTGDDDIDAWSNSGSVGARLFHEHIEDLYMMWMTVPLTPDELFNRSDQFTYVILFGNADYLVENTAYGEQWYQITRGHVIEQLDAAHDRQIHLALEVFENDRLEEPFSVIAIPSDSSYRITWKGNGSQDNTGLVFILPASVALSTTYDCSIMPFDCAPGTTGTLIETQDGELITPGDDAVFDETTKYIDASDFAWLLGLDHMRGGWRITIAQDVLIACLLLIGMRAIVASINRRGSGEPWRWRFVFSSLVMLSLAESEVAYWLFAGMPQFRLLWKALAGVGVLLYCFCCRQEGSDDFWSIFLALALCMAGDLAINFWFLPGVVLFALAHLNLIRFFLQKQPLRRTTWVWWVLISLMLAAGATSLTQGFPLSARIGAPVYAPILLLTLMCGLNQTGNLKLGAVLLVVSDCALAFYFMKQQYPYVHMAYMALYYLALIIICRALLDERVFIGTPHHMRKQEHSFPWPFPWPLPWNRKEDQSETDEDVANTSGTRSLEPVSE